MVEATEVTPKKGRGKPGLVMIGIVGIVVIGLGVTGYLYMAGKGPFASAKPSAEQAQKDTKPPAFVKFDSFVVNLAGSGGKLLQVELEAETVDAKAQDTLNSYMPAVRSGVILLLSSKSPEELDTPAGKLKLKNQIVEVINGSIDNGVAAPVKSVEFTSFIIQNQ